MTRVFTNYRRDVVEYVTDSITGLPARHNFPPDIKDVKAACDDRQAYLARREEDAERRVRQLAERAREEAARKLRPTPEDMVKRYGENYGLASRPAEEAASVRDRRRDAIDRGNRAVLERVCAEAGVPVDGPVSPVLAAIIRKDRDAA